MAGTRESVQSISREAMIAYKASHYTPGALVIGVAGDITHEVVLALVERLFGAWETAPGDLGAMPPTARYEACHLRAARDRAGESLAHHARYRARRAGLL